MIEMRLLCIVNDIYYLIILFLGLIYNSTTLEKLSKTIYTGELREMNELGLTYFTNYVHK